MADVRLRCDDQVIPLNAEFDSCELVRTRATARQITLNLVTGGLGIGLFSLPWSTAGASIIMAVIIQSMVFMLNAYTISVLVTAAETYQVFDVGSIMCKLPGYWGKIAQHACNASICFTVFLSLVGYITVMADATVTSFKGSGGILENRSLVVVLWSVVMLLLCFLDQAHLSFTSFLSLAANALIFMIMVSAPPQQAGRICYLGFGRGCAAMFSTIMQTVAIQGCVLPMYGELKDRSPAKFDRIIAVAFGSLWLIFVAFSVLGYITFGTKVGDNILDDIPYSPFGKVAKWAAAVCVAAIYPIEQKAMVAPIRNFKISVVRKRFFFAMANVGICILSMTASLGGFSLGYLNVVSGALACLTSMICPAVVGLVLLDCRPVKRFLLYILLVVGTVMGPLGLVYTSNYIDDLQVHCTWKASGHHGHNLKQELWAWPLASI